MAPTSDDVNHLYTLTLNSPQHTSHHSHMSPPTPHTSNMNPNTGNLGYERGTRPTAEDNTQPRFELFLLGDGEKKVTEEADTRKLNICCFHLP